MLFRLIAPILLLLTILQAPAPALAGQLRFVDADGAAIADVVVELIGTNATANSAAPVMDQVDKQFVPHVLTVVAGQAVSFPNSDNIRHHVYSFSTPKVFEIKLFSGTDADPVTFETPGVVVLGCNIHDTMVGYIYVADGNRTLVSDASGTVTLPDGEVEVWIWHPRLSADQNQRLRKTISTQQQEMTLELLPEKPRESKRSFKSRYRFGGS